MPGVTIEQLAQLPIVILMYPAGASGEFIAWALSESITGITKTTAHWENHSRCKYSDALGRSLNGGNDPVLEHKVIERFEIYQNNTTLAQTHLALAHPDPATLNFIQQHFSNLAMIEIQTNSSRSKKFRYFGSEQKITKADVENSGTVRPWYARYHYLLEDPPMDYTASQHLKIEWEDLMLAHPAETLVSIARFVNSDYNATVFENMVAEYLQRNQQILAKIE